MGQIFEVVYLRVHAYCSLRTYDVTRLTHACNAQF